MKTKSILLLLTPFFFCAFSLKGYSSKNSDPITGGGGHRFVFKIKGAQNTQCMMGCYFGDKSYVLDSAKADAKGSFTFAGDTAMPGGVYFIILKNKNFFEFIIDKEQKFAMSTDTADLIKNMKVDGSPENQAFYEYRNFAAKLFVNADKWSKEAKAGPDREAARAKLDSVNKVLTKYKDDFVAKHPDFLLSKVFKAAEDPEVPPTPTLPNGRKDSSFAYRYYKAHFFDNLDLSDGRMVRTPPMVFFERLKEYVTKMTFQQPDSLNACADYLISKARKSPDMFKFIVYYITNTYETSNIMGLDEVFVHMVKKYYTPDQAFWVSASQLEKMRERAEQLEPILLGKKAPEIVIPDTSNVMTSLDSVKARYTIVVFWDYDCGLCQQEIPKLIKFYDSAKGTGIEVFAVETDAKDPRKWKDYIIKHKLDWFNVTDLYHTSNYQHQYDEIATPTIYVLDEDKHIIAKKIDVKDLDKILKHDMQVNANKK